MSLCVTIAPDGTIVQATQQPDPAECYAVVLTGAEYRAFLNPDFTSLGITPESVLQVAAWGFGAVIGGWVLGLTAGWVVGAINRA